MQPEGMTDERYADAKDLLAWSAVLPMNRIRFEEWEKEGEHVHDPSH